MINQTQNQAGNPDEPIEIRDWTKSKLFTHLNDTFLLPDKDSRGVTRSYLVGVYTQENFRVERSVILQFESGISLAEQKKAVFYNVGLLVERLDRFLQQLQMPRLGFGTSVCPEEKWFTRILRYIDRTNVLGGFRMAIQHAPVPDAFSAHA